MRLALGLVLANYIAFAAFVAIRPSAAGQLREKDAALAEGRLSFSSAEPYTYIAARPLYNWSEWHGGEHLSVKVLEIANLPALQAAGVLTPIVGTITGASFYHGRSYVRAFLFGVLATIQWLTVGLIRSRALRRPPNAG